VHLLVSEPERRDLSVVLKVLKQAVARRVLAGLRRRNPRQGELFADASIPPPAQTSKTGSSGAPSCYLGHPPFHIPIPSWLGNLLNN
jgi:hypothetical protein